MADVEFRIALSGARHLLGGESFVRLQERSPGLASKEEGIY